MNVAAHVPGYRIVAFLVPDILETLVFALFLYFLEGLIAAVEIKEQDAIVNQGITHRAEIRTQGLAFLEQLKTEVHGQHNIDRGRLYLTHVFLQQGEAHACSRLEAGQLVPSTPGQYLRIDIHPDGRVLPVATHPLTAHVGSATEVLTQARCTPPAQLAKRFADELVFRAGILNRLLIENMPVGALRHGFPGVRISVPGFSCCGFG